MKDKILAWLKGKSFVTDDKVAEISRELDGIIPAPSQPTQAGSHGSDDAVKILQTQIDALTEKNKQLIDAMTEEAKIRKDAQATMQKQLEAEKEKKIKDTLNKAMEQKKFAQAERTDYEALLKQDYDRTVKVIEKLPGDPALTAQSAKGGMPGAKQNVEIKGTLGNVNQKVLSKVIEQTEIQN